MRLENWIEKHLIPAMVFGGMGIQGIAQTPFYTFISSAEGLSQLGIKQEDPIRLLKAYQKSFKIIRRGSTSLELQFGNEDKLMRATPHPFNGRGKLRIKSWLEWVVDGRKVSKHGFVTRPALPPKMQRFIRLRSPLGGLMLPKGAYRSTGFWQFPPGLQNYEIAWFKQNVGRISKLLEERLVISLQRSLN